MNKKGFSILNILILIGIIALIYIAYNDYYLKRFEKKIERDSDLEAAGNFYINVIKKTEEIVEDNKQKQLINEKYVDIENKQDQIYPKSEKKIEEQFQEKEQEEQQTQSGYYENKTYNYSIVVPAAWPLRVRSEDNVFLGIMPPRDGQGALTIEVDQISGNNEIEQAKKEAQKYVGMISIKEEKIFLGGVSGEKIILDNLVSKTKSIFIVLEKNNLYYLIKYSEESKAFVKEIEDALKTFKFI